MSLPLICKLILYSSVLGSKLFCLRGNLQENSGARMDKKGGRAR